MENAAMWQPETHTVLDVRPDLARGDDPFVRIIETAATVQPGKTLMLIAPFEPVPLYAVMDGRGFTHATERVANDEWVVAFTRL